MKLNIHLYLNDPTLANFYYQIKKIDKSGQGWIRSTIDELKKECKKSKSTIYDWLKRGKNTYFKTVELNKKYIYIKYNSELIATENLKISKKPLFIRCNAKDLNNKKVIKTKCYLGLYNFLQKVVENKLDYKLKKEYIEKNKRSSSASSNSFASNSNSSTSIRKEQVLSLETIRANCIFKDKNYYKNAQNSKNYGKCKNFSNNSGNIQSNLLANSKKNIQDNIQSNVQNNSAKNLVKKNNIAKTSKTTIKKDQFKNGQSKVELCSKASFSFKGEGGVDLLHDSFNVATISTSYMAKHIGKNRRTIEKYLRKERRIRLYTRLKDRFSKLSEHPLAYELIDEENYKFEIYLPSSYIYLDNVLYSDYRRLIRKPLIHYLNDKQLEVAKLMAITKGFSNDETGAEKYLKKTGLVKFLKNTNIIAEEKTKINNPYFLYKGLNKFKPEKIHK